MQPEINNRNNKTKIPVYENKIIIYYNAYLASQCKAQENQPSYHKGLQVVGGDIGYSITSGKGSQNVSNSDTKTSFIPKYGYFISQNWSIGLALAYEKEVTKSSSTIINISYPYTVYPIYNNYKLAENLIISPYFAYHHKLLDKFYFDMSCNIYYSSGKTKTENHSTSTVNGVYQTNEYTTKVTTEEYGIGITPGLTYFFSKHWAANINLGVLQYSKTTATPNQSYFSTYSEQNFSFDYNLLHANLGVNYYFSFGHKK